MSIIAEIEVAGAIEKRLDDRFSPSFLTVEDVSSHHIGHAGARPGGQTHFEVTIIADELLAISRVAAHRLIHHELADFLAGPVHALQIALKKS